MPYLSQSFVTASTQELAGPLWRVACVCSVADSSRSGSQLPCWKERHYTRTSKPPSIGNAPLTEDTPTTGSAGLMLVKHRGGGAVRGACSSAGSDSLGAG